MALITVNWNPSRGDLRWFAGLVSSLIATIGAVAWWRGHSPQLAVAIWGGAGLVGLVALLRPALIRPVFIAWMGLAYPVGWVVSHLLLGLIFYGVVTPIGLLMRRLGYDSMRREFDRATPSYWMPHEPADTARYFRQF
jgi:hypothetical protein